MKYSNHSFWNKIISSPIFLFLIILVFVFLVKAVWGIKEKRVSSDSRLSLAETELDRLEQHRSDLTEKINYLSTEKGVEAELKTKYGAVYEGESVAVIIDENNQRATAVQTISTSSNLEEDKLKITWFGKILKFFGLSKY